jgi:hypothetical protein
MAQTFQDGELLYNVRQKLNSNAVEINALNSGVTSINSSINSINSTLSGINQTLISIDSRLDALEYLPITVSTFTNNINNVELGSTVSSITFNYSFNKLPTAISINNGIGVVTGTTATKTVSLSATTTYTITANDGQNNANATTTVNFLNKAYWGTSASTGLTNSNIIALSNNTLTSTRNRTITLNGNGQYIYYCYPASLGDASFTINGFISTSWIKTTQSFTNSSGYTTTYNIYRSTTIQNGSNIQIVIS